MKELGGDLRKYVATDYLQLYCRLKNTEAEAATLSLQLLALQFYSGRFSEFSPSTLAWCCHQVGRKVKMTEVPPASQPAVLHIERKTLKACTAKLLELYNESVAGHWPCALSAFALLEVWECQSPHFQRWYPMNLAVKKGHRNHAAAC